MSRAPTTTSEILHDALARLVAAAEALDYGNLDEARAILTYLEGDLAAALRRFESNDEAGAA